MWMLLGGTPNLLDNVAGALHGTPEKALGELVSVIRGRYARVPIRTVNADRMP